MRFIAGIIIGIALTLGGAYVHDINISAGPAVTMPAPDDNAPAASPTPGTVTGRKAIVNWDILAAIWHEQTAFIGDLWDSTFKR